MVVWVSSGTDKHKRCYHLDPDCYRLRAGVARNKTTEIVAIKMKAAVRLRPCSNCVEDRKKFFKPRCEYCKTWRACPHNGGVLVRTRRGMTFVWPDQAILHQPLDSVGDQG